MSKYPAGKIQADEYAGVPRLWIGRRVHTGLVSRGYSRTKKKVGKRGHKFHMSISVWELRDHGVVVGRFSAGRGGVAKKWIERAREVFYADHLAVLAWESGNRRESVRYAPVPF